MWNAISIIFLTKNIGKKLKLIFFVKLKIICLRSNFEINFALTRIKKKENRLKLGNISEKKDINSF